MQTLTEKRVFGAKSATSTVYVACEMGLVAVTVSADRIGEFGLIHRGAVSAVTVDGDRVVIGTDEGVFAGDGRVGAETGALADRAFSSVAGDPIGRVVAAGTGPTGPLVADAGGGVFRIDDALAHLADVDAVRAIDGGLLAAKSGVFRVADTLTHVGLNDARDVSGHGVPLAATADGLFRLANGWLPIRPGSFDRVASDGHGHAVAVGTAGLCRHVGDDTVSDDTAWVTEPLPTDASIVDVAYGSGILAAITDDGTLRVDAGDGWRTQRLGVRDVRALAVGSGHAGERGNRNRV